MVTILSLVDKDKPICFGGIQKSSLIDFPGKVSCVLFVKGCNFRCPYCHNPELVEPKRYLTPALNIADIKRFLEERKGLLDGVVISGGEPTLQPGLFRFCMELKGLGYSVKLDTNGSRPDVVEELLKAGAIDYVAMDIKSGLSSYAIFTPQKSISKFVTKSIEIIMESSIEYEFRTTCFKPIINDTVMADIARKIAGAKLYALQNFQNEKVLDPDFFHHQDSMFTSLELEQLKQVAEPWVQECIIR